MSVAIRLVDTPVDRAPRPEEPSLDPPDRQAFRDAAHRILDALLDWEEGVRDRPAWMPVPEPVRARLRAPPPAAPSPIDAIWAELAETVLPYAGANTHPRFWGWVQGSGTPGGALAELVAATLNANLGGREHAPVHLERQVVGWWRDLFGFPAEATGLIVSGTSLATLIALTVARNRHAGHDVREQGLAAAAGRLVAYASGETHGSVVKALEILGLGRRALRRVPVDRARRIDVALLREMIAADRARGLRPLCIVGNAGTVDTGAIDDLEALAGLARAEGMWLHVDGAFGAAAILAPGLRDRLAGIERADSLAFDFHKWLHVPYAAGCVLVRDGAAHRAAFATDHAYLRPGSRGHAGGAPWACDLGPELSRSFAALKVWWTIKEHGLDRLGAVIARNVAQAAALGRRVEADARLRLAAPVALNIVCFRYDPGDLPAETVDRLNEELVADLHEAGIAVPSTTRIDRRAAIRVCLCNHRTRDSDLDLLLEAVLRQGQARWRVAVAARARGDG
jgi:glutamate/tyrosine decarboxylase-like PLP-dependent enzyme